MKLKPVALSLSQSEIDEIATELLEAMQPDWQNAVALPSNFNGYVAPENGMIVGWATRSGVGNLQISINGVVVARGDTASSIYAPASIQCIVNKGDVITSSTTPGSTMSFVPFKTSNPVSLRPLDPHKIDAAVLNHWDDITSDFSTAGSATGIRLDYVKYNPVLRMLKYKVTRTQATAAGNEVKHELIYNGSEMIAFNANSTILLESINFPTTITTGYEVSSKIVSSNQIEVKAFNRTSSSWESGHYFTGVIYL